MSKMTLTRRVRFFQTESREEMVGTGVFFMNEKKEFVEKKELRTINTILNERRAKPLDAQVREKVGECGICRQPVVASVGQLIHRGEHGISHKACRGRGKNKIKKYG